MCRSVCLLAALLFVGGSAPMWAHDQTPESPKKIADGVYAVLRESLKEKDVRPLKDGEVLVVDRHPYLKKDEKEPPRFLVVHAAPDVDLDLAGAPKAYKDDEEVVGVLLKLQPKAATALERLTSERVGKQIAIVVGGEVVTVHKIRAVIKGGEVQITCCAARSAKHLLEQLHAHHKKK
jgi:preprotein translocase subunit SecD